MSRKLALSLTFCVVVAATCLAQDFRGNLGGTVLDSSGAVVPGVEVKAVNVDTGIAALGSTNEAGKFTIRFLLPGTYRVVADKPGSKRTRRKRFCCASTIILTSRSGWKSATLPRPWRYGPGRRCWRRPAAR